MTRAIFLVAQLVVLGAAGSGALAGPTSKFEPPADLIALDRQIDWSRGRLIAVQELNRYKTFDSFAREALDAMYGREHFPKLTPLASYLEWAFNTEKYQDEPLIRIRELGLRIHFTAHMTAERAAEIRDTQYMTLRELTDPIVQAKMQELEPRFSMAKAMGRVRAAEAYARMPENMIRMIPVPGESKDQMWLTPREVTPNLPDQMLAQAGHTRESIIREIGGIATAISSEQAVRIVSAWSSLRAHWLKRDAAGVQRNLDDLAAFLPTLASAGVYPTPTQLQAEFRYYGMGKFTWGYIVYFVAALVGVWALASGWRTPWVVALLLLAVALGLHAYGLGLRWYILGRIPVGNMFEAISASAWMAVVAGVLLELVYRTRLFTIGAALTGFVALVLGHFVLPGMGMGTLTPLLSILDDVMLRIHTTMIIASYAMIFLAAMIGVVYVFGYYYHRYPARSAEAGVLSVLLGAVLISMSYLSFRILPANAAGVASGVVKVQGFDLVFGGISVGVLLSLIVLIWLRASGQWITATALLLAACVTKAVGNQDFVRTVGIMFAAGGAVWALLNLLGVLVRNSAERTPELALAGPSLRERTPNDDDLKRPLLAGGAPGDEGQRQRLPLWLHHADWSQMILLNMVFVILFVGTILGAVWADYSWGRPWGWDPKEVFAMNTWLIYAVLIHTRFVVAERGIWTAWLSIGGAAMMAFNWFYINTAIVGLHSYA